MNDAVREADKIVGKYLKRLGYVKPARKVPSKKGGRIAFCAAVSLAVCVFLSYIILKITI